MQKVALRIVYGSIFCYCTWRLQACAVLCVSSIVEIRMDCGFAIYGNIWANAMSSIVVVVVVVNIHMDKKMVVDVRAWT